MPTTYAVHEVYNQDIKNAKLQNKKSGHPLTRYFHYFENLKSVKLFIIKFPRLNSQKWCRFTQRVRPKTHFFFGLENRGGLFTGIYVNIEKKNHSKTNISD